MRLKPDGTLDLDWREPEPVKPWRLMTPEEQRDQLIEDLMHAFPTMTREEVTEQLGITV
jgi:hypothetical protein